MSRALPRQFWFGEIPAPHEAISASFHGRDLFAPVAGMLARGDPPDGRLRPAELSRRPDWLDDLPEIVYIDRFGNAITGMRAALIPDEARLATAGRVLARRRTFFQSSDVRGRRSSVPALVTMVATESHK